MIGINKIAIVFDTNSYRGFVSGKNTDEVINSLKDLKESERKKNIIALAAPIVALEMLSHLSDGSEGPHFKDCFNGSIAMALHTSDDNFKSDIILEPFLQLSNSFFLTRIPEKVEENQNIIGVTRDLAREPEKALRHHIEKRTFFKIKAFLDDKEKEFCDNIIRGIEGAKLDIKKGNPNITNKLLNKKLLKLFKSQDFKNFQAIAILTAVATLINSDLLNNGNEIINRALKMNKEMPFTSGFRCWLFNKIIEDNIDMNSKVSREKRWNWIWDEQIVSYISESKLSGREVIIVTGDKDITKVLHEYGYNNKVMTLEKYIAFIS